MTLESLATEADLAYSYMGGIERGQRNPSLGVVERIAMVLESDPHALLRPNSSKK
ncbi:helix-turn-helix domain-containing protein [Mesorhizobium sp. IRAMC:0171]|uniref:Helix-turn-helix domain-containing protein n=2 Tax=Mesorhizobium retamae TaxID=2912854 RepID=A0ABS9QME0_9HYPH|nr:helix-turn-helix domain-containing protein [Mesorhizobium sp. IRAMC:0171]